MKKIGFLLGGAFVIITVCMLYLVRKGISLRTAPLIKPTEISTDRHNIAEHLVLRLFPELQSNDIILWGILPENAESQALVQMAASDYERMFKTPVHFISNAESATLQDFQNCKKPCWILLAKDKANELTPNEFIDKNIQPLNRPYITLTLVNFTGAEEVTDACENQHRLHLDCLVPLSVRDAKKKMKDPNKLYFFLRKYNDRDYFLFTQTK
ncbi:hypothetical protein [Bdellovibrio sp. HCB2-146]|uniref:hypothetical protein n=1 Tax=Bdellovibrio sp. HCB2-146 TaxID=3394362 RepID=UPI0039BCC080